MPTLEQKIHPLLAKLTQDITDAVKADMLARVLDGPPVKAPRIVIGDGKRKLPKGSPVRTKAQMRCRHPGCKNKSRGPRFGWRCSGAHEAAWRKSKEKAS